METLPYYIKSISMHTVNQIVTNFDVIFAVGIVQQFSELFVFLNYSAVLLNIYRNIVHQIKAEYLSYRMVLIIWLYVN